ncbi:CCA tRNA nucleotidyltransferase [Phreatobacter stygius]|uniref:CCA tRNA nucleotidyltransferase n=1 Tax=Phreatobacter stygius TaxID=1940610 RepID=A0A4D7BN12_9HYPH|nr:CCA tRNA nucleotidyltransferase [Phreatobacter stygius]
MPVPDWLSRGPAARLLAVLNAGPGEARPVGGAVRNALIGMAPGDIDIATSAVPEAVVSAVKAAGFKSVPTGITHGTVTVVVEGRGFEVTTLREDIETDGRRAVVRFGHDWKADASRRDFTVNAMSLTRDGVLHDYFGGEADLRAGRIRFIGDPIQRIREDRLRILRFFRFHATYAAGEPDAAALAACIAERQGLAELSRERLRMEIMKLVIAGRAGETLQVMADAGLLGPLIGGVPFCRDLSRLAEIERLMELPAEAPRRLAALAVLVREDADRLRDRLSLSNEEYRRLDGIGHGWHGLDPAHGELAAKAVLFAAGPRGYRDRALVAFARSGAPPDDTAWRQLATLAERWKAPAFPISGNDLVARGFTAGPELGAALAALRAAWIAADFPTSNSVISGLISQLTTGR